MTTEGSAAFNLELDKLRLDYLTKQYGFYTGHMNQVFNFFIVAVGLILAAFVNAMTDEKDHNLLALLIAGAGILLTFFFCRLHSRGFVIAGILDRLLLKEERRLGINFMRMRKRTTRESPLKKNSWLRKHASLKKNTGLFILIYCTLFITFFACAGIALLAVCAKS